MNVKINEIRSATSDEWLSIWNKCPYSTIYHSELWADIWSKYTEGWYQKSPLIVSFSDGKKSLLPFSRQMSHRGSMDIFVSSPLGKYGGWLSDDVIGREHVNLLKNLLSKDFGYLYWYINPFDEQVTLNKADIKEVYYTNAANLETGFDMVFGNWSSSSKRAFRKAQKSGVLVKIADTEMEWFEYYKVYEDTIRRWGERTLIRYKWILFQELYKRQSSQIKLWLSYSDSGRILAGAIMGYSNTHA